MLSSSFSRSLSPQSLLCAGTYRPRRWASIWIHELSLKSCAADGIEAVYMVYRDTVVSTARLRRALILQLTLQLISGALAATPVAVNGHAPILDALLFPKWFILFFRDVDMSIQSSTQPSLLLHNELLRSSTYFGTSSSKIHTSRCILQEKKRKVMKSPNLINLLLFFVRITTSTNVCPDHFIHRQFFFGRDEVPRISGALSFSFFSL